MKLKPPLSNLIARCETICRSDCCGIDAYDFSPLHISSYLTMHRGSIEPSEVDELKNQLESIRKNYGITGTANSGVELEEMNQKLTAKEVSAMCNEITHNIAVAVSLAQESSNSRWPEIDT